MLCDVQLTPEVAEIIAEYDRVCFVDAHTGHYREDVRFERIEAGWQASPFTHHMTPQTCLMLAETLHGRAPKAVLVSVRGHEFGFSSDLSGATLAFAEEATDRILRWLDETDQPLRTKEG